MASRKQQKEAARQRRLEQERAAASQVQRRRRMQMLAGVVVAAVVVIVAAIAISSNGSSGGGLFKNKHEASQTYAQVNDLLEGIPQSGTTLGDPQAKLTMYYFGDLECPYCQAFTLGLDGGGLSQFIKSDVRTGKVKLIYRSFCTATCNNHPESVFKQQQVAAYAAGKQDLFWDYAELFYHEQGDETTDYVNASFLDGLAKQIPKLDLATWQADQKDPTLLAQVEADENEANRLGLEGTPTLIASGPKGETEAAGNVPTYSQLQQALKQVT